MNRYVLGTIDLEPNQVTFNISNNTPILTIKPTGEIIWESPKGTVVIEDERLLGVALMDVISNMTDTTYDLELLSKDVFDKYLEFLDSRESSEEEMLCPNCKTYMKEYPNRYRCRNLECRKIINKYFKIGESVC